MDKTPNKLSRRDALKILGAVAGASALANLPQKWNSPSIANGVLPAHAQTSCLDVLFFEVLSADGCVVIPVDAVGPLPTTSTGDGSAGSTATWDCTETGCLAFGLALFDITSGNPSATVQITTLTDVFIVNIGPQTTEYVLVDLDTGSFDLNFASSAGGCDWPFVKGSGKPSGWFER